MGSQTTVEIFGRRFELRATDASERIEELARYVDRRMRELADVGAAPTALKAQLVLKPGETKYVGIPTSDLFYATQGNTLKYRCHLHPAHVGGTLVMIK